MNMFTYYKKYFHILIVLPLWLNRSFFRFLNMSISVSSPVGNWVCSNEPWDIIERNFEYCSQFCNYDNTCTLWIQLLPMSRWPYYIMSIARHRVVLIINAWSSYNLSHQIVQQTCKINAQFPIRESRDSIVPL